MTNITKAFGSVTRLRAENSNLSLAKLQCVSYIHTYIRFDDRYRAVSKLILRQTFFNHSLFNFVRSLLNFYNRS